MKVLHVLANSPPDVNGYAIRTQKILSNQTNELVGLTSPWYPNRESMIDDFEIDGVKYYRTIHPQWKKNPKISQTPQNGVTRVCIYLPSTSYRN